MLKKYRRVIIAVFRLPFAGCVSGSPIIGIGAAVCRHNTDYAGIVCTAGKIRIVGNCGTHKQIQLFFTKTRPRGPHRHAKITVQVRRAQNHIGMCRRQLSKPVACFVLQTDTPSGHGLFRLILLGKLHPKLRAAARLKIITLYNRAVRILHRHKNITLSSNIRRYACDIKAYQMCRIYRYKIPVFGRRVNNLKTTVENYALNVDFITQCHMPCACAAYESGAMFIFTLDKSICTC